MLLIMINYLNGRKKGVKEELISGIKKVIYLVGEKKKSCIKMSKLNPHADIKLQR